MTDKEKHEDEDESLALPFSEFLESSPPGSVETVSGMVGVSRYPNGNVRNIYLKTPDLQLHCTSDNCNGIRFFRSEDSGSLTFDSAKPTLVYVSYKCSNCKRTEKIYSLMVRRTLHPKNDGECTKLGELPPFGPPTPARLIKLIGPDREVFLKGRRCENQGLGIGAFVYYRRVVESQKNRILDQIIKVAQSIGADSAVVDQLNAAKLETRFSQALEMAKDVMPESLKIDGHSPLGLLHRALSDGLHEQSDEHCLAVASSVRVVLAELSERLAQALKDEDELKGALATLLNIKRDG